MFTIRLFFKYYSFVTISAMLLLTACSGEAQDKNGKNATEPAQNQNPAIAQVTIGGQVWTAENLSVSTFSNGDRIGQAKTREAFEQAGEAQIPAWCYPDFNQEKGDRYGKLYNWHAVNDPRGLAPEGWHVASDDEWDILANNVGGSFDAAPALKSTAGWFGNANGTNSSGFNALPTGGMSALNGYSAEARVAVFWSATEAEIGPSFAYYRVIHAPRNGIFREEDIKLSGFAVRCVRN
jgi:uncharacterized protein (TIGR02145 family)